MKFTCRHDDIRFSLKLSDNFLVVGCDEREQLGWITTIFDLEFPNKLRDCKIGKLFYHNRIDVELDLINQREYGIEDCLEYVFENKELENVLRTIMENKLPEEPLWKW